ncbi:MAG: biliverdin-producing heme oxygenase [Deltaproteobacteria bacterium]
MARDDVESVLSHRLRSSTQDAHRSAERSAFMRGLLGGALSTEDYRAFLDCLLTIYTALEAQLRRNAANSAVACVFDPRLERVEALARDLDALGDTRPGPLPEARAYAAHLEGLGDDAPERLVAHAYVRYLGDLSGGQLLDPIVQRSVPGAAETGRSFYAFGDVWTVRQLAAHLREGLDRIANAYHDAIVDEAQIAFDMHATLFAALEDQRSSRIDRMRS